MNVNTLNVLFIVYMEISIELTSFFFFYFFLALIITGQHTIFTEDISTVSGYIRCADSENIRCADSDNIRCADSDNIRCADSDNIRCADSENGHIFAELVLVFEINAYFMKILLTWENSIAIRLCLF